MDLLVISSNLTGPHEGIKTLLLPQFTALWPEILLDGDIGVGNDGQLGGIRWPEIICFSQRFLFHFVPLCYKVSDSSSHYFGKCLILLRWSFDEIFRSVEEFDHIPQVEAEMAFIVVNSNLQSDRFVSFSRKNYHSKVPANKLDLVWTLIIFFGNARTLRKPH